MRRRISFAAVIAALMALPFVPLGPVGWVVSAHPGPLRKNDFIAFDPSDSTFTFPTGINPQGHIVGVYSDPTGKNHGFVLGR
jgi:hypothetical protein